MSSFRTSISVDIDAIKKLLPSDHVLEKITYDRDNHRVDVIWFSGQLQTPYTAPTEFTVKDLMEKELPANTKLVERKKPVDKKPGVPSNKSVVSNG